MKPARRRALRRARLDARYLAVRLPGYVPPELLDALHARVAAFGALELELARLEVQGVELDAARAAHEEAAEEALAAGDAESAAEHTGALESLEAHEAARAVHLDELAERVGAEFDVMARIQRRLPRD